MKRAQQYLRRQLRRLDRDQAGNVMVIYIAAALLMVGMVWAIIGTGQRVVQKETIQTSADAAAFSAAVIKAKGMNIIAFCNLLMALLLAVIMLLRLINDALTVALAAVTAACVIGTAAFGSGTAICALEAPISTAKSNYSNIESTLENSILKIMNALAELERAVQESFPALSLVEAYQVGTHAEYKQNFGTGQLITIAWPLPVGEDLKLPAQDGTWSELCDRATQTIATDLIAVPLTSIGLSGSVAGTFSSVVRDLLTPLEGVLCPDNAGSSTSAQPLQIQNAGTSCSVCKSPPNNGQVTSSMFTGASGTCTVSGAFPSSACDNPSSATLNCSEGYQLKNPTLLSCSYTTQQAPNLGGQTSSQPKPLDLTSDWASHNQVRAFTLLTDSNMSARRAWAGISTKSLGSAPALNQLLGMAQAEFFQLNGASDLWHMDWRARLVRFSFSDTSQTNTGSASGVPAGGASAISSALSSFLQNDATAALANQFLLH